MKKTILLVEDNDDLRSMIKEQLEGAKFKVIEAENGDLAFSMISKQRVDLVLTDIDMPVLNGIELMRKLKSLNIGIPCVLMSGGNYVETSLISMGAIAFIPKQFATSIDDIVLGLLAA